MESFDIIRTKPSDKKALARLLGFKKILVEGEDMEITERHEDVQGARGAIRIAKGSQSALPSLIKEGSIAGAILDGLEIDKKLMLAMKDDNKILILNASSLTTSAKPQRIHAFFKMRNIVSYAMRIKCKVALASLAESEEELVSSMQLLEIANMLCRNEAYARKMISALGEII
jgi:hypothetical protein